MDWPGKSAGAALGAALLGLALAGAPGADAPAASAATSTTSVGGGAGPDGAFYAAPELARSLSEGPLLHPAAAAPKPQEGPAGPVFPGARPHEFYFSRAAYSGYRRSFWGGRGSWSTDFPKADQQFLTVLNRLVDLDAYDDAHPVRLDDPKLRRFPFLYALEVGGMRLNEAEVRGLREYLLAGGFLVVDDFWGSREWENFEAQMRRVLPDHPIVELPRDHPIFSVFYEIDEIQQVPNVRQGIQGGATWENDGFTPRVRGIYDDQDRLMAVINWNTDLGDAWEWAEHPYYPLRYSTFAIQMGVNMIVYGMSH